MRLFSFLIPVILFSCTKTEENQAIRFKMDHISLSLSETVPVNPWYVQLIESDSGEYVFLYNHFKSQFQFLDLNSGSIAYEIRIQTEGDHGIRGLNMGSILGEDSLWFTNRPSGLGLLNFSGEVMLRKPIVDESQAGILVDSNFDRRLYKHKNKIFGNQALFMDHHRMDKNSIKTQRLVFSYDIKVDSVAWYNVFYKDSYWEDGKKPSGFSWTERNGKLYIAPYHDHEVQVFDLEAETVVDSREVKSNYVNKFNFVNELPPPGEGLKNRFASDRYSTILYDKYRDIFYRLFLPSFDPGELDKAYNPMDLEISRPVIGIMVLDSELKVIGELLIEDFQIFSSHNHFVGKKGLYLSNNNLFNAAYNEDEMRYLILTPEL